MQLNFKSQAGGKEITAQNMLLFFFSTSTARWLALFQQGNHPKTKEGNKHNREADRMNRNVS